MSAFGRTLNGAMGGLSRLAASLAGGGAAAEQNAFDQEVGRRAKLAQALAQVKSLDAQALLHGAQADQVAQDTATAARRPGIADLVIASTAGVDVPTLSGYRQKLQTGQAPTVPMGPPDESGGMGAGSMQFDPATASRISQALVRMAPILNNEKDINPEQYAKAAGMYQDADQEAAAARGEMSPLALATLRYAAKGSAPYHFDASGLVGNNLTGRLDESSGRAQAVTGKEAALGNQATAGAAENYAQAGSARALADKYRAEMNDGMGKGGKAPAGYRWLPDGRTLETIPGGPADPNTKGAKQAKPPTEGQAKALMFGSRMAAADEVLGQMESQGTLRPGNIKAVAEGVAGAIPIVGDSLANAAGAATNWTQSADQQSVEQAQRDFVNAVLRRESGAAISPQEFANATRQYFPQPGDSPQVLRQKAANRKTSINGFRSEFGEAMAPEFDRIVSESRRTRKAPGANQGGASGGYDAPDGWSIEKVK